MTARILLVDDDRDFRWATGNLLRNANYGVAEAADGQEALAFVDKEVPELVLLDDRMPRKNGMEVAQEMGRRIPGIPIIMITAYGDVKSAVKAMKIGIYDYVTKPVDNNDLMFKVQRALEKQNLVREVTHLRNVLSERATLYDLMGRSDKIKELVNLVEKVSPTRLTVLIEGESGSGKELVARAIHSLSEVQAGPFVAVDCGAIPETLIESELFGYMKGAFTGAETDKPGQFELAQGGTLFLDEVSNLPYQAQQKLLRAMQERVIQRLGGKKPRPIDVRIIAATNQALDQDMGTGGFRADLYFRLKEFSLRIPPLRERKDDLSYLIKRFMDEAQEELKKPCGGLSKAAAARIFAYEWPGNVRELKNMIRQAVLLCPENGVVDLDHLPLGPQEEVQEGTGPQEVPAAWQDAGSLKDAVRSVTDQTETRIIQKTLTDTGGNKSETARRLKVDYKTLLRKIKAYGIE
ncbi:MAG: sigma-54 dependent transcriptional regulator [Deltaproteobacteria bacterium]|nr:sigma-54 dependent transcriptional regulator [Deltaproteobacteria bacterium]